MIPAGATASPLTPVLDAWEAGALTPAEFARMRALCGLHEQRAGAWMLRLKAPGGRIAPGQWRSLACVVLASGPRVTVHLTSRQAVEIHGLTLQGAGAAASALAGAHWSTRGSGGDGVRNVTVPALCGLLGGDAFDPYPYAEAFGTYFEGREEFESLPRKFKVTFTTPASAEPGAYFHDLAFIADPAQGWERGFRVLAGGGLGARPQAARELRAFLPAGDALRMGAAVARVWARSPRRQRSEGRLKHLVRIMGFEEFKREVEEMFHSQADPGLLQPSGYRGPQGRGGVYAPVKGAPGYSAWLESNARPQAGGGWWAVVRTRQGQLGGQDLAGLGEIALAMGLEELRLSSRQQVYLPGLDTACLPELHRRLDELGLAQLGHDTLSDVCACPGPRVCNLGAADPRSLARELAASLSAASSDTGPVSLRVSGCANSCCHHRAADLGLQGLALKQDGHWYPAFLLYAGGGGQGDQAFGQAIGTFPAARVQPALRRLLEHHRSTRLDQEGLAPWLRRKRLELQIFLAPFHDPEITEDAHFREIGASTPFVPYARGTAQC